MCNALGDNACRKFSCIFSAGKKESVSKFKDKYSASVTITKVTQVPLRRSRVVCWCPANVDPCSIECCQRSFQYFVAKGK